MFKNKLYIRVKGAEDREYNFDCQSNAPLGEIHDVLYTILKNIIDLINKEAQKFEKKQVKEIAHKEDQKEIKDEK